MLKTKEFYATTKETQIAFGVESNQMIIALLYKGCDSVKRRSVSLELSFMEQMSLFLVFVHRVKYQTNGT